MISEVIECPKCSKQTLIQRNSDLYQCLSCDFERDFSQSQEEDCNEENTGNGILMFLLVVFTLFALL